MRTRVRRRTCAVAVLALGLGASALAACATTSNAHFEPEKTTGVGHFQRPPGMPIGTGASGGDLVAEDEREAPPAEVTEEDARKLAIPKFEAAAAEPLPVPCSGCVELNLDVSDINQRDEFAFDMGGVALTRVVWTLLVTFNSDQLAVQPFIDAKRGKYTALHVNNFPLGVPVELEQEFSGKAYRVGLVVGSSGAWTGNQRMSVFVDAVRGEGPGAFSKSFDTGDEGLVPRTNVRHPGVVFHPPK
ncbi:MAG TPA: hypothetical protein VG963_00500 [Polyangiaceae bacterium]|nr:hypothetical protein [Polyangiaceae bacterium]